MMSTKELTHFGDSRLPSRFWEKASANTESGCWEWRASKTQAGYGCFNLEGTSGPAHRVSYQQLVGPVAEGLELDHLCRNRCCVNPSHLEQVTSLENKRRGKPARGLANGQGCKTHCKRGHEFSPENTHRFVTSKGGIGRQCIACRRAYDRKWKADKRASSWA